MTTEWYYESMGKVIGPLTAKEILVKVRSGEITPATKVRKDDSQWVQAEEVNGLFDAATRPLVQHICPYCGAKVGRPPVTCTECNRYLQRTYSTSNTQGGKLSKKRSRPSTNESKSNANGSPDSNGETLLPAHTRRQGFLRWLQSWWRPS